MLRFFDHSCPELCSEGGSVGRGWVLCVLVSLAKTRSSGLSGVALGAVAPPEHRSLGRAPIVARRRTESARVADRRAHERPRPAAASGSGRRATPRGGTLFRPTIPKPAGATEMPHPRALMRVLETSLMARAGTSGCGCRPSNRRRNRRRARRGLRGRGQSKSFGRVSRSARGDNPARCREIRSIGWADA